MIKRYTNKQFPIIKNYWDLILPDGKDKFFFMTDNENAYISDNNQDWFMIPHELIPTYPPPNTAKEIFDYCKLNSK